MKLGKPLRRQIGKDQGLRRGALRRLAILPATILQAEAEATGLGLEACRIAVTGRAECREVESAGHIAKQQFTGLATLGIGEQ